MASTWDSVDLGMIEEGKFLTDVEKEFANIQDALIRHVRKYGASESTTKAVLTVKVELFEKNGQYGIITEVSKKIPGRPKGITAAVPEELQTGGMFGLFAQSTGTNKGDPNQRVMDVFSNEDDDEDDDE